MTSNGGGTVYNSTSSINNTAVTEYPQDQSSAKKRGGDI